ncbi:MAG: pyridoxal phosphate-dependent decarboxylase family protein [Gemmatimonadaceae bacterium]
MQTILSALHDDSSAEAARLFTGLAVEYLTGATDRSQPVSTPRTAAELAPRFDEPFPSHGHPLAEIAARIAREVIPDSNRLYHPRYIGHQVSAPLPAAVWSESLIAALNQSVAVWEMSPVATLIEERVIAWMRELAGYGSGSGGTLTSGGTEATFTALLAARAAVFPDAWGLGMHAAREGGAACPAIVCGEHAHYAVARAAGEMGIGVGNVETVPSRDWRMDHTQLAATLDRLAAERRDVIAVVATAGSTATGSFDDLEAIGLECERRGLWLHVDGAHGASALLSAREAHRVRGIARAQSIAWDPHKMMLMPLSAGVLLVRDERALERAFAQRAPYLFHGGDGERIRDQGVRSFQCSRRADAIKLWVAMQRYGREGLAALYEHLCDRALALHRLVEAHPQFVAVHAPTSNILCFRWTGDGSVQGEALDEANRLLRERYNRSGHGWITTTILGGQRVLRATIMNPRTTDDDLWEIVEELGRVAGERSAGQTG